MSPTDNHLTQRCAKNRFLMISAALAWLLVSPAGGLWAESAAEPGASRLVLEFPAIAEAKSTVEIIPPVPGLVTQVFVGVGQKVKRGDTLLTIDPSEYEIEVERARIDLDLAESLLSAARTELDQTQNMVDRNLKPENALGPAVLGAQLAEIGVREAETKLKAATLALEATVLKAPIDGVVSRENVAKGDRLLADLLIAFVIVDYDPIVVAAHVDQKTDLMLFRGLFDGTLRLEHAGLRLIDGSMYPHSGEHVGGSNMVDPKTGRMIEYYTFPNQDLMIPSGASVTVIATYNRTPD